MKPDAGKQTFQQYAESTFIPKVLDSLKSVDRVDLVCCCAGRGLLLKT